MTSISTAIRKRLVAIDLDGTLLNQHHNLSERSIKVLRELSDQGITISIATGRSKKNIERYVRELALSQPFIPVICYNGAYGLKYVAQPDGSYECHEIFANSLPNESTQKLIEFGHRHDYVLQVCLIFLAFFLAILTYSICPCLLVLQWQKWRGVCSSAERYTHRFAEAL